MAPASETFTLENSGNADREGHTPRGFMGEGGGIFTGDNLNGSFPEGDGVQIFLSINLARSDNGDLTEGSWTVDTATFAAAVEPDIAGTPFADLGNLVIDEVDFDMFSSALWDLEAQVGGDSCTFADAPDGAYACDLSTAVQNALDNSDRWLNLRMRFEQAGDSDGIQDMVFFNMGDTNSTSPGLFSLVVEATSAP